jgi:hypothetical protein
MEGPPQEGPSIALLSRLETAPPISGAGSRGHCSTSASFSDGVKRTVRKLRGRSGRLVVRPSRCRTTLRSENLAASSPAPHNPKVAGSNPAPATKKTLGIPTCAEGFLASRVADDARVKPASNIGHGSDVDLAGIGLASLTVDATTRAASAWEPICADMGGLDRASDAADSRE